MKYWLTFLSLVPAFACSVPMCLGRGAEMASSFTVALHREGRPLVGAKITVAGAGKEHVVETGPDGTFRFSGLASGDYSLSAQYLGIRVAWQCFHIRDKSSRRARGSITFGWDDGFLDMQGVRGFVSDSYKWHKPQSPLPFVQLNLQNLWTREIVARTTSADDGHYLFPAVPNGEYVLVIASGGAPSGIEFDESRLLVRVNALQPGKDLNLAIVNTTCGSYLTGAR